MHEPAALQQRGAELFRGGRPGEALALFDAALARWPHLPQLWNNRGTVLIALQRYEEAAAALKRALRLAPEQHASRVALATCQRALGDLAGAISSCEEVLARSPGHPQAHWNLALFLLLNGEWERGWREYEWRWETGGAPFGKRSFPSPRWEGEELSGRRILIHAEQGLGDSIQFCRFLPQLVRKGGEVIFECDPSLHRLFASLGPGITPVARGEELPRCDLHLPLLSLPLLLRLTPEAVPAPDGYLRLPGVKPQGSGERGRGNARLQVGLCWSGKRFPDPYRSCPASLLAPLAEVEADFHSLQVGETARPPFPLVDRTGAVRDFADTAELMHPLDLVISIDTSVAHLCGALGIPCWILLPSVADWRWGVAPESTPWYAAATLFRQRRQGEWQAVIAGVRDRLSALSGR